MDELQRVKRDLKRLRTALPPLPTPDTLYDDIVDDCRNVMRTIESLDELRNDIEYFYHSNLRYGELEREAQILELKAENCKLELHTGMESENAGGPKLRDARWTRNGTADEPGGHRGHCERSAARNG
ncbi:hypothetical protein Aduo_018718 [Ancylostoma duodenale]